MRRELILVGAFVKDARRGILYEVIDREPNKVSLLNAMKDPDDEPETWLIGVAESRLQPVPLLPDWDSVAEQPEWGSAGTVEDAA